MKNEHKIDNRRPRFAADFLSRMASPSAAAPSSGSKRATVKWDEESLALNESERGVKYGTMKIDHPDTPFIYYDACEVCVDSSHC